MKSRKQLLEEYKSNKTLKPTLVNVHRPTARPIKPKVAVYEDTKTTTTTTTAGKDIRVSTGKGSTAIGGMVGGLVGTKDPTSVKNLELALETHKAQVALLQDRNVYLMETLDRVSKELCGYQGRDVAGAGQIERGVGLDMAGFGENVMDCNEVGSDFAQTGLDSKESGPASTRNAIQDDVIPDSLDIVSDNSNGTSSLGLDLKEEVIASLVSLVDRLRIEIEFFHTRPDDYVKYWIDLPSTGSAVSNAVNSIVSSAASSVFSDVAGGEVIIPDIARVATPVESDILTKSTSDDTPISDYLVNLLEESLEPSPSQSSVESVENLTGMSEDPSQEVSTVDLMEEQILDVLSQDLLLEQTVVYDPQQSLIESQEDLDSLYSAIEILENNEIQLMTIITQQNSTISELRLSLEKEVVKGQIVTDFYTQSFGESKLPTGDAFVSVGTMTNVVMVDGSTDSIVGGSVGVSTMTETYIDTDSVSTMTDLVAFHSIDLNPAGMSTVFNSSTQTTPELPPIQQLLSNSLPSIQLLPTDLPDTILDTIVNIIPGNVDAAIPKLLEHTLQSLRIAQLSNDVMNQKNIAQSIQFNTTLESIKDENREIKAMFDEGAILKTRLMKALEAMNKKCALLEARVI